VKNTATITMNPNSTADTTIDVASFPALVPYIVCMNTSLALVSIASRSFSSAEELSTVFNYHFINYLQTTCRTTPRKIETSTPKDIPVDIFGSRTPTTPPTSAPMRTNVVNMTPKSFILGSAN
jgi:hypothetical protein